MARRGRPPYPDLLTPREQEVHELLRDGLSNPEIAERLGISLDGAKYHVSEILSKLGVATREEAARLRLEAVRPWWAGAFAPLAFLWRRAGALAPVKLSSAALVVSGVLFMVAVAGLGLMAFLLMRGDGDSGAVVERPGDDGFRQFAVLIQDALDRGDRTFFEERAETTHIVCTADDLQGGPGGSECQFEGQSYDGFPLLRWGSEASIIRVESVLGPLAGLAAWDERYEEDEFGDGGVRVYALSLAGDKASAVITALTSFTTATTGVAPYRIVEVTHWSFQGEQWTLDSRLTTGLLREQFLIPCQAALEYLGGDWERYPHPSEAPMDPSLCPLGQ